MWNKFKPFLQITGVIGAVLVLILLQKDERTLEINIPNALKIQASLINIDWGDVLYVKCKFKNAGVLRNSSNKHGISAILGSLMFRKMQGLSPEETLEKIAELGVMRLTANPFGDDFVISFFVLKDGISRALDFLAPAFWGPTFSKNDLEFVKEKFPLILDIDSSHPRALLLEKLTSMLYANHSYGLNSTGTAQAIVKVTADDIDKFVQSKFVGNNLEIIFAGNVSALEVSKYLNIFSAKLSMSNIDAPPFEKIKASLSKEKISVMNNPKLHDLAGVMTGVRIDDLTDLECAALYVLLEIFYNHKTGIFTQELRSRNISHDLEYSFVKRSLSSTFYTYVFIQKSDLENYLKYLEEKTSFFSQELNPQDVEKAKNYLIKLSLNKSASLGDIEETNREHSLPFQEVSSEIIAEVAKKMWDKSKMRIAIIGNKISVKKS
jgi:predicted Zn-dependent peptidase